MTTPRIPGGPARATTPAPASIRQVKPKPLSLDDPFSAPPLAEARADATKHTSQEAALEAASEKKERNIVFIFGAGCERSLGNETDPAQIIARLNQPEPIIEEKGLNKFKMEVKRQLDHNLTHEQMEGIKQLKVGEELTILIDNEPVRIMRSDENLSLFKKVKNVRILLSDGKQKEIEADTYGLLKRNGITLIGLIGSGAMGIVYDAYSMHLRDQVCIKTFDNPEHMNNPALRRRFLTEARAVAKLRHDNILGGRGPVYDNEMTGPIYLETEHVYCHYFDGTAKTLGKYLDTATENDKMDLELRLEIFMQIARGLSAAHRKEIVHRDLKPDNILLFMDKGGNYQIKIIDLGLATMPGANNQTQENTFLGTPNYMAPEQAGGTTRAEIPASVDVHAFAVIMYEMLSGGKYPFNVNDENHWQLFAKIKNEPPEPLEVEDRFKNPKIAPLVEIINRILEAKMDSERPKLAQVMEVLEGMKTNLGQTPSINPKLPDITEYTILDNMGEVGVGNRLFRAINPAFPERPITIKLPPEHADEATIERFRREMRILMDITHRNIVKISSGKPGKKAFQAYQILEWLDGTTLGYSLKQDRFEIGRTLKIIDQIAGGLGTLHEEGIIHRGLTPNAIFLHHDMRGREIVKIVDLGQAKETDQNTAGPAITMLDEIVGSIQAYMSPEQLGRVDVTVDKLTDIYAIGVILYELLTAQLPDSVNKRMKRPKHSIDLPSVKNPAVTTEIDRIVMRCLEWNKSRRYQNTEDLRAELKVALINAGVRPSDPPESQEPPEPSIQVHLSEIEDYKFSPEDPALIVPVASGDKLYQNTEDSEDAVTGVKPDKPPISQPSAEPSIQVDLGGGYSFAPEEPALRPKSRRLFFGAVAAAAITIAAGLGMVRYGSRQTANRHRPQAPLVDRIPYAGVRDSSMPRIPETRPVNARQPQVVAVPAQVVVPQAAPVPVASASQSHRRRTPTSRAEHHTHNEIIPAPNATEPVIRSASPIEVHLRRGED